LEQNFKTILSCIEFKTALAVVYIVDIWHMSSL